MDVHMPCGRESVVSLKGCLFKTIRPTRPSLKRGNRSLSGRSRSRHLTCAAASTPLATEGWSLWSALAACAAVSQVVEKRTPFGAVLSAPLVSMLAALCLAVLGIIPTAAPTFDTVWTYVMPLGAALCLLEMPDLRRLWGTAASTLVAFLIGAAGTVLGTLVAFRLFGSKLGPEGYKVAAALCASYIGGSINFAAVSQTLGLAPGHLLAGAMAADNLAMAAYIGVIMAIPAEGPASVPSSSRVAPEAEQCPGSSDASGGSAGGRSRGGSEATMPSGNAAGAAGPAAGAVAACPAAPTGETAAGAAGTAAAPMTAETASLALAAAAAACTLGNALAAAIGFASGGLAVMALCAAGFAMLGSALAGRRRPSEGVAAESKGVAAPFAGSEALGTTLCLTFFATIGAGAGSLGALAGSSWLLAFIAVQLSVHLLVIIGAGRLLRLPMRSILIASNANVGGSATAAAMASGKRWQDMTQPAMLTGSLGYAIATGIGTALGQWLRTWRLG